MDNQWKNTQYGNLIDMQPADDLRPHEVNNCWCDPELEIVEGGVIQIHHSADGREKYERGELRLV